LPWEQYQRLESKGNPRLDTLELVAKGLNSDIMLIPREKIVAVLAVLEGTELKSGESEKGSLSNDPWQDLLGPDS